VARAIVKLPSQAKKGEIIEIRTLASHTMETGFRHSDTGKLIPRDIITRFVCTYNGAEIFSADLYPAISANPYLTFSTLAVESGQLEFKWTGDNGFSVAESANITVV